MGKSKCKYSFLEVDDIQNLDMLIIYSDFGYNLLSLDPQVTSSFILFLHYFNSYQLRFHCQHPLEETKTNLLFNPFNVI